MKERAEYTHVLILGQEPWEPGQAEMGPARRTLPPHVPMAALWPSKAKGLCSPGQSHRRQPASPARHVPTPPLSLYAPAQALQH